MLGMSIIKADIKELTKEEAIIAMVDSNLHRSKILPSEKAKSYKMRMDAVRKQGFRSDLASSPIAERCDSSSLGPSVQRTSRDDIGADLGESGRQVSRYIRLNELIPEILEMVDNGDMALRPAVEISYLPAKLQKDLLEIMKSELVTPSHAQAIRLKKTYREDTLDKALLEEIMAEIKPNQKEKLSLNMDKIRRYIPDHIPLSQTEDYILKSLAFFAKSERKRNEKAR